ncbi:MULTISPECIES: phage tail domain-containing protein [unclassified Clostridium]|uniref:phage distal tail protein n=1 Tax=unclassified Clostridium TaxID=2614128 RepID=UPI0011065E28|nr:MULTISPECIES: phage tail domain-containing protein [unclassified Clostridium]
MNGSTVFTYENSIGKLTFERSGPLWITEMDGVSSVELDISESRSAGQIGASITNQSVRPRSFTIDGVLFDPVEVNRERMLDVIAPQIPATLTYTQGAESWYLNVVPEKTPEISPGEGLQSFQFRLRAAYPYWRTTASYAAQVAGLVPMFRFPFYTGGTWWISKFSDSYFNTLTNEGNVPVEFRVVFTARGALTNPELYHVDTRKRILIKKAMTAGEKIVVSTVYGEKGVTCIGADGVETNGFKFLSVDSDMTMTLVPGPNLLRIDAATNRDALGVRIEAPKGVKSGV